MRSRDVRQFLITGAIAGAIVGNVIFAAIWDSDLHWLAAGVGLGVLGAYWLTEVLLP